MPAAQLAGKRLVTRRAALRFVKGVIKIIDVETAGRAQVLITMAVQSYREGRVLYFDKEKFKVVPKAPRA